MKKSIKKNKGILIGIIVVFVSLVLITSLYLTSQKSYSLNNTLYDMIEEDILTNGYGSTYTGDHADTVDSDGNPIVGSKNIYYYTFSANHDGGGKHVVLGGFCWKVLRTTDTGGVKLVFNGEYYDDLECGISTAVRRGLPEKEYNTNKDDAKYVGYKYKTTNYNDTDSTMKEYIDNWYENNLQEYSSLLEDVVFCNDRTGQTSSYMPNYGTTWHDSGNGNYYYHNYFVKYDKLSCDNKYDRFSTNNSNAKLSYPIALPTAVELNLFRTSSYGYNEFYWSMSPSNFSQDADMEVLMGNQSSTTESGSFMRFRLDRQEFVRPVISLKPGVTVSGVGFANIPYIVENNVDPTKYAVVYNPGDYGTITGTTEEEVDEGGHPSGRDVNANDGFTFKGWVADKDVTLSNGTAIAKDKIMTDEQIQNIVVNSNITLTAKYYRYLYDQVEEDVTKNSYGSTYTGEHADTVQNNGAPVVGNKNIYYYTETELNNVKLGNTCFKIMRTTDTGGVKLIYSGTYSDSSKCNNSGNAQQLEKSVFNENNNDSKYAGYKYKTTIYNDTDSTIKTHVDNWYEENMTSYTDILEDAVFCNDRTGSSNDAHESSSGTTWNGEGTNYFYYHNNLAGYQLFKCEDVKDRFSKNNNQAKLKYSVGLLTYPEYWVAYYKSDPSTDDSSSHYITGGSYWTMSPASMSSSISVKYINYNGGNFDLVVSNKLGVRPVVSLKPKITFVDGNGSVSDPYIIGDIVDSAELTVSYNPGQNATIAGTTEEKVDEGGHPSGRDVTANEGYEFKHWVCNKNVTLENGTTKEAGSHLTKTEVQSVKVTEDLTFTAVCERKPVTTYTVTYESPNGTITGGNTETVNSGGNPSGKDVEANEGYEFKYWTCNKNVTLENGTTKEAGSHLTKAELQSVKVTEDLTFTAVCEKVAEKTAIITYKSDDYGLITGTKDEILNLGENPKGTKEESKTGYHTIGWICDKEITLNDESKIEENKLFEYSKILQIKMNDNLTCTVNHEIDEYLMEYEADEGGSLSKDQERLQYGKNPTVTFSLNDGYKFVGWYCDKDVVFNDGSTVKKENEFKNEKINKVLAQSDLKCTAKTKEIKEAKSNPFTRDNIKPYFLTAILTFLGVLFFVILREDIKQKR